MLCTVIHAGNDVEIVDGDVSADPQLQRSNGGKRFWVAVAKDGVVAHRWTAIYWQYLTDRYPQRHFSRMLELLSEGVTKQFITPAPLPAGTALVKPARP